MRKGMAAVALGLALAGPAGAQQLSGISTPATFFNGANPRNINFTPINTAQAFKQINGQIIRTPSQTSAFSLSNIFHSLPTLTWPPRIGQSTVPAAKKNG